MHYRDLKELQRFSDEKMQKIPLFESERMFYDLYCLLPGQSQKVHSHDDADKIYLVLEGEAMLAIGDEQELLSAGMAVMAPAGTPHGVRNDSLAKLVLLVTMAPKPQHDS